MSLRARLEKNLEDCLARMEPTAGRDRPVLVAVTKKVSAEVALELAALGLGDLGESRVQEFGRKLSAFQAAGVSVRWHFLGHLQRNKARKVVREAYALHSLDSMRLLDTIGRLAREEGRAPMLFLQVKIAAEETKTGFAPDDLPAALARARKLGLDVLGLMTMAPGPKAGGDATMARDTFRQLARLASGLPAQDFVKGRPLLSMGMSNDFEQALAEGADYVRIGSALFRGLQLDTLGSEAQ